MGDSVTDVVNIPQDQRDILTRQIAVAAAMVEGFAPNAPVEVQNEAALRLIGWMYDNDPATARAGQNPMKLSGAASILAPWVRRSLVAPTALPSPSPTPTPEPSGVDSWALTENPGELVPSAKLPAGDLVGLQLDSNGDLTVTPRRGDHRTIALPHVPTAFVRSIAGLDLDGSKLIRLSWTDDDGSTQTATLSAADLKAAVDAAGSVPTSIIAGLQDQISQLQAITKDLTLTGDPPTWATATDGALDDAASDTNPRLHLYPSAVLKRPQSGWPDSPVYIIAKLPSAPDLSAYRVAFDPQPGSGLDPIYSTANHWRKLDSTDTSHTYWVVHIDGFAEAGVIGSAVADITLQHATEDMPTAYAGTLAAGVVDSDALDAKLRGEVLHLLAGFDVTNDEVRLAVRNLDESLSPSQAFGIPALRDALNHGQPEEITIVSALRAGGPSESNRRTFTLGNTAARALAAATATHTRIVVALSDGSAVVSTATMPVGEVFGVNGIRSWAMAVPNLQLPPVFCTLAWGVPADTSMEAQATLVCDRFPGAPAGNLFGSGFLLTLRVLP